MNPPHSLLRQALVIPLVACLLSLLPQAHAEYQADLATPAVAGQSLLLAVGSSVPNLSLQGESLQSLSAQNALDSNTLGYALIIVVPMMLFILLVAVVRSEKGVKRKALSKA